VRWNGILFDLDGTLWNATHITALSWQYVKNDHPEIRACIDLQTVQKHIGKTNDELAHILFPAFSYEKSCALIEEACAWENRLLMQNGGILYPDIQRILAALSAVCPLFIASNCQSGYIETFLAYHAAASYFTDYICAGDTGRPKGENICMLCHKHSITHPVFVGDTLGDAQAAQFAGCDFLHAAYGFGEVPASHTVGTLTCPADLLKYIEFLL